MNRILIIDDDVDTCNLLARYLKTKGYETAVAFCGNKGLQKFKAEGGFNLVICDYRLGDKEGSDVLKEVKQIDPKVRVVIITGYSDIKTAVRVIKEGAYDYISKPLIPEEVLSVVRNASQSGDGVEEPASPAEKQRGTPLKPRKHAVAGDDFLKGNTPVIKSVYREVDLVAPTGYSIILYGESGTGKEVIAKAIHRQSPRASQPFIALDCGTLSRELAGSELFGHVKGAFTGALDDKAGHFEIANGGTLFLDEVANLPYDVQASLLRVIQERKFKRIGGTKEMGLDIRIIVASNENLEESYRKGRFREDLYHRLNEFSIVLPALRKRKADIPLFAQYFLDRVNDELGKNITGIDADAMHSLVDYSWPGNIRELKNVIRRATLLAEDGRITRENLPWHNDTLPEDLYSRPSTLSHTTGLRHPEEEADLKGAASYAEYETVMNVLRQVNYNKSQAAIILKIDRKTLYNKLKKFGEEFSGGNLQDNR
jgi:two-component system response regulator HydG